MDVNRRALKLLVAVVVLTISLLMISLYLHSVAEAIEMPQQMAVEGPTTIDILKEMDWKQLAITAVVIFFPGFLAMTLVVVTTTTWRKGNVRKQVPVYEWDIYKFSFFAGAVAGPVCQFGLQGVIAHLFNLPIFLELVLLAIVITGPASLIWYEVIRSVSRKRGWYRVYAWLSVKKLNERTGELEHHDGDVTRLAKLIEKKNSVVDNDDTVRRGD